MVLWCNRAKVGVRKFYEKQNDLLEAWKEDEKVLTTTVDQAAQAEKDQRVKVWDTRLATITIILNVFLIIAKTTAAILSDSLSVVASVVDRLEPLTTLIVGLIMVFANLLVLQEAAVDSVTGNLHPKVDIPTLVILCTGTSIKAVLFLICRSRNTSASRVLAIDQRNDCITNLVALAGAYIGHRYWKYADPIGATCVSGFIIITWLMTVREQIPLLIGKTADPQLINRIVNIDHDGSMIGVPPIGHVAISHDDRIKHLDTVMDREISLCDAHDVSETLQNKLEQLSFVERAFVHCDYQFDGDEHV
ncbi:cation efflux family protein [Ancylostoma duodenale]|uniref:Cation efflux family protein n=1 Tax=Ancylostoma duodenale TaxID=51022 RepID=A0A0C2GWV5_9BILA|nr:cation efflux family protein [Ancylostoma duodenale]